MFKKIDIKKIALLTTVISIFAANASYANIYACKYDCPKKPYNIGNPISRGFQNISGMNFLATKVAESQIKKQIKKYAQGDVEVNIDSYSLMDLASGKFKSLKIKASDLQFKDIFISSVEAASLCEFISIDYKANPIEFREPLSIGFKGVFTKNDLNKIIAGQGYLDHIININANNKEYTFVKMVEPKVELAKDKMILKGGLWTAGMPEGASLPISISTGLKVVDSKIKLADIKVATGFLGIGFKVPPFFYETLNPIIYCTADAIMTDNKINFSNITINDNQINIEGSFWLPKSNNSSKISK